MLNSNSSAGTAAQQSTKDELNPSSPTCTKPYVSGCTFLFLFLRYYIPYHGLHTHFPIPFVLFQLDDE